VEISVYTEVVGENRLKFAKLFIMKHQVLMMYYYGAVLAPNQRSDRSSRSESTEFTQQQMPWCILKIHTRHRRNVTPQILHIAGMTDPVQIIIT